MLTLRLQDGAFRPAPVELRGTPKGAGRRAPPPPRGPRWLLPAVLGGLVLATSLATLASPDVGDQVRGAITAVQTRVAEAGVGARWTWRRHLQTTEVAEELRLLRRDHERLRIEAMHLRTLDAERRRLAHLLQMSERQGLEGVGARVVAHGTGSRRSLRLDAGAEQGIAPGMAVIDSLGVVGQVLEVGTGWSDVLCVTDPSHGLAGVLDGGAHGTLRGMRDHLQMDHVLASAVVGVGTVVRTSGQGGVFPAGLPIGVVSDARPEPGSPFLAIEVRPAAPPSLLREVLVVTGQRPTPGPALP